jgi:hypothetical protein
MEQASKAGTTEQAVIRETLYNKLIRLYNTAQNYNFSQIHFHLPNGDSFLRFHNVSEFGDSLLDFRASIRMVIDQKRIIAGFEGGRYLSGYRYVYPLFNKGNYVGSVELAVSATNIVTELYKSMGGLDVAFIIKEDIIESSREGDVEIHHEVSLLSEDYLIEKNNLAIIQNNRNSLKLIEDEAFNQALKNKIEDDLIIGTKL